jgi:hypothetical protein
MVRTGGAKKWIVKLTGVLSILSEELVDLVASFAVRNLHIVLGATIIGHEGEESVVGDVELFPISYGPPYAYLYVGKRYGFLTSWNSRRETLGTSILWVEGHKSSIFLPVKMSTATKWTLA